MTSAFGASFGSRDEPAEPICPEDSPGCITLDVRVLTPSLVRPLLLEVVDWMVAHDARDDLVVIVDHEPTGIERELDLRRQTRGLFSYESHRRSDGAWVELIRRSGL